MKSQTKEIYKIAVGILTTHPVVHVYQEPCFDFCPQLIC